MELMDFVVCDDIRPELGNKFSLMGVYERAYVINALVTTWPYTTRLALFIRVQFGNEPIPQQFEFRTLRRGEIRGRFPGAIPNLVAATPFSLVLNLNPFGILEPGIIDFEIAFFTNGIEAVLPLRPLDVIYAGPQVHPEIPAQREDAQRAVPG